MPILWRYLLGNYFKVLLLCVIAFVAILLTTRLDEIAHFATMGPEGLAILSFTFHQIPYILPIAIPISCLISSMILMQRLSQTRELTALRAAGLSFRNILTPLLLAAALLSLANLYTVSELATHSHLKTGKLKNELRSLNPLLLLHNKHILKLKGIFFNALGETKMGEKANDVIIALPNQHHKSIQLLLAKNLSATSADFVGSGVTLLTSYSHDGNQEKKPEVFLAENIQEAQTTSQDFSQIIYKKVWTLNNDHLRLPLLITRLAESHFQNPKIYSEIMRRLSVALAAFTFTFLGLAYGVSIGRHLRQGPVFSLLLLSTCYLICFFAAKHYEHAPLVAALLYFAPHAIILTLAAKRLRGMAQGALC